MVKDNFSFTIEKKNLYLLNLNPPASPTYLWSLKLYAYKVNDVIINHYLSYLTDTNFTNCIIILILFNFSKTINTVSRMKPFSIKTMNETVKTVNLKLDVLAEYTIYVIKLQFPKLHYYTIILLLYPISSKINMKTFLHEVLHTWRLWF
jgi:hypothetical protein